VRKTDDSIPDYREDGFIDDHQEVRAVTVEFAPLLQAFKAWRLRSQVPGMWRVGNERVSFNSAERKGIQWFRGDSRP